MHAYSDARMVIAPVDFSAGRFSYAPTLPFPNGTGMSSSQFWWYGIMKDLLVSYKGPGNFVYDFAPDWATWGGPLTYDYDNLHLLLGDMPSFFRIESAIFYHRLSSAGLASVSPGPAGQTATKDPSVTLTLNGATFNGGQITPSASIPLSGYRLLNTDLGIKTASFGCYLRMDGSASGSLYGWDHTNRGSGEHQGHPTFRSSFVIAVNEDGSLQINLSSIDLLNNLSYGQASFNIPDAAVGLRDNQRHFLHIDMRVSSHQEPYGGDLIPAIFFRIFVDGQYRARVNPNLVMGYFSAQKVILLPGDATNGSTSHHPTLGATSTSDAGFGNSGWGSPTTTNNFSGSIDDPFLTNWMLFLPDEVLPAYTYMYDNDSDTIMGGLNPSVTNVETQTRAYRVRNSADPTVQENIILYGPVEEYDVDPNAAVRRYRVQFTILQPVDGQRVEVSYRASPLAFSVDSTTPEWTSWSNVTSLNSQWVNVDGSSGRYFQIRLRITPSDGEGHARSPTINRVDYIAEASDAFIPIRAGGDFFLVRY